MGLISLLVLSLLRLASPEARAAEAPFCELYAVGHFGNSWLDHLSGDPLSWYRRQWQLKADMFAANQAIGTGDSWTSERRAHADEFWAAEEKLQREVYGIGPLRHILNRRFIEMPWYKSWAAQKPLRTINPEQ